MSTIAEDHFLIYLNSEGIHFMCGCWGVSENIAFITGFNIPSRFQDFDKEEKKKIKWIFIFIPYLRNFYVFKRKSAQWNISVLLR